MARASVVIVLGLALGVAQGCSLELERTRPADAGAQDTGSADVRRSDSRPPADRGLDAAEADSAAPDSAAPDSAAPDSVPADLAPDATTDASLSNLEISAGTLGPAFSPSQLAYAVSVGPLTTTLQVTPTAATVAGVTIRVNGAAVASGTASAPLALAANSSTTIAIEVVAAAGTSRSYFIIVLRGDIQYLKASNADKDDRFGSHVSLSGDTLAVSAPREASKAAVVNGTQADNSLERGGAVYVFVRNNGAWSQQAYLKASNSDKHDEFGSSLSLSGDTLAVGAAFEKSAASGVNNNADGGAATVDSGGGSVDGGGGQADNTAPSSGAVYVFVRNGSTWKQQAYLKASNTESGDQFGWRVSLSGDTLAVGARYEDGQSSTDPTNNAAENSGAVYVFVRNSGAWTQQAYLKASNAGAFDLFGFSVSVDGDTLAVGAREEDGGATGVNGNQADNPAFSNSGAVYVFVRNNGAWTQQAYLKASNTHADALFGYAVSLQGDTLAVGALWENGSALKSGAVYVFTRSAAKWSQQAYLKASNAQADDQFGSSLSLSGDTLAVAARSEDSAATGVDGDQKADDGQHDMSGAVYLFRRNGTTWSQERYVKASNTGRADQFGWSVSLSVGTLVVGAAFEDSPATGVNDPRRANGSNESGAVYVYDR